jgi:cobalamin-dependent methionine synthase I
MTKLESNLKDGMFCSAVAMLIPEVWLRFFGLRQQAEKQDKAEPYVCISDFVAPKESGLWRAIHSQ